MQYPMTIFPRELVRSLTYLLPLAFVNWYPCLFLLGRTDPFGLPRTGSSSPRPWPRWCWSA